MQNKKSKIFQWLSLSALIVTIVLEALPYGAVLNFAPSEQDRIRRLYSYFDFTPFGYANFAPFITAILTVALIVLVLVLIFVKRKLSGLRTATFVIAIIAAVVSICPIFYGLDYVTIISVFITLLLTASAVFCGIANAKQTN